LIKHVESVVKRGRNKCCY